MLALHVVIHIYMKHEKLELMNLGHRIQERCNDTGLHNAIVLTARSYRREVYGKFCEGKQEVNAKSVSFWSLAHIEEIINHYKY